MKDKNSESPLIRDAQLVEISNIVDLHDRRIYWYWSCDANHVRRRNTDAQFAWPPTWKTLSFRSPRNDTHFWVQKLLAAHIYQAVTQRVTIIWITSLSTLRS